MCGARFGKKVRIINQFAGYIERFAPTQTDDADTAAARGCCKCDDRIRHKLHFHHKNTKNTKKDQIVIFVPFVSSRLISYCKRTCSRRSRPSPTDSVNRSSSFCKLMCMMRRSVELSTPNVNGRPFLRT